MPPHAASGPPGLDLSRTLASVPLVACLCACPSSPPPPTIGGDETSGSSESTDAATTVAATTTASTSSTANGISADESGSSTDATSATWGSSSGGPEALTANDDELFVLQGGQLVLPASSGLLSNDVEGSGGPPSVVAADAVSVAGGTPIVGADGALTYLPPAGFWGRDAFDYTIADSATEVTASVTVFVAPVSFGAGELDGESGGYVIEGVWGHTMAPLRDVNGDDLADVVVGAPGFSANGSFSGRCYVVFGKPDFASIDVVGLFADSAGYVLNGEYQYARACASVSTTDDLDGDGLDELIVGSTLEGGSQAGRTYVAFGKADASPVELSAVTQGSGGFRFDGEAPGSYSGRSVANIGDANGDGVADIAIGASSGSFDGAFTGRVYVVFGDVTLADRPLSEIGSGIGGFVADGPMLSGFFGWRVGAAGDVNADGLQDIFVTNMVGAGFVIFGKADTDEVDVGYFASIGCGFRTIVNTRIGPS
jgi:hypothetical protein